MEQIILMNPRRLVFGEHSIEVFAADYLQLGLKKLYLVTVPPVYIKLEKTLERLVAGGVQIKVHDSLTAEPSFSDFERVLAEAKHFGADSVAGIGGGSVLDVAKLVAAQLDNTQSIEDVIGIGNLKGRSTYLACIPTTSGTGSEVSPNAIFVNKGGAKVGIISPHLIPDASYVDPYLTVSVPASVTASTGIDALSHCLEAYTNRFAHPVVDLIALEGVRLIAQNLKRACVNGHDLEARSQVALGSLYGGMCLGPVNTTAVHALAYPLGTDYHIPHGLSIALLLPHVMQFNLPAAPDRYAKLAMAMGAEAEVEDDATALESIRLIQKLIRECGLPGSLQELNIPYESIEKMAEDALKIQRLLKNNIRTITQKDAEDIYRSAFYSYEPAKNI
jgi:alcohol dehydrogenase